MDPAGLLKQWEEWRLGTSRNMEFWGTSLIRKVWTECYPDIPAERSSWELQISLQMGAKVAGLIQNVSTPPFRIHEGLRTGENSWGKAGGKNGFIKFGRNHGNCALFQYSSYARLLQTERRDTGWNDEATTCDPEPEICSERASNCAKL